MRLGEVCEFPSAHDGEELEDAGHGHAVGAGQGGQHRHQQQRPVRDVGVQQREHVNSAQGARLLISGVWACIT